MQGKGLERKKHDFPYNEINKKQSKKGVSMPMSLSHKSVKKHNKKLPANVTNHKIVPVQENMYSVSHLLYQGEHKLPMEEGFQACQILIPGESF